MVEVLHAYLLRRCMHWFFGAGRWDYNIPGMVDTAKALADLQAKGLIKHVGELPQGSTFVSCIWGGWGRIWVNRAQAGVFGRLITPTLASGNPGIMPCPHTSSNIRPAHLVHQTVLAVCDCERVQRNN